MRSITFFLLAFCLCGKAQQYVPLPLSNCYWHFKMVKNCMFDSQPQPQSDAEYKIFPSGDTIINSLQYKKFYAQELSKSISPSSYCQLTFLKGGPNIYEGAIRQDTALRKIFYIAPQQSTEKILYDFNVKAGDSLKTMFGALGAPGNPPNRVISKTYYQSYNDGICRKTFEMQPYVITGSYHTMTCTEKFTEGIGNENGLFFNYKSLLMADWPDWSSMENWTSTFFINGVAVQPSQPNNCVQDVGILQLEKENQLLLYPNPASEQLFIKYSDKRKEKLTIKIYNTTGIQVLSTNSENIDIHHLPPGCYHVSLTDVSSQATASSRFIKQ